MFTPLPTPKEMHEWDQASIRLGLPEALLMENASREALHVLHGEAGGLQGKRVLFFMGSGNNGGDAACLARHVHDCGASVLVLHTRPLGACKGVTGLHVRLARRCGVRFAPAAGWPARFRGTPWDIAWTDGEACGGPDVVVDGLLGTGFSGSLRSPEMLLVGHINALRSRALVFALDVPSGLSGLTGRPCPVAVRARATVSFEAAKPGLVLPEALPYTGSLYVRPIGIPAVVRAAHPASFQLLTEGIFQTLPGVTPGWHKGTAGAVLVVGGSKGLTGAPHLAALGALRAGAGLVSVAAPQGLCRDIKADCPDIMTRPLGAAEHLCWSSVTISDLLPHVRPCGALVLGPGLGREPETAAFVRDVLACSARPAAVVDADALHALAVHPDALASLRPCDILTPHPGEAATLLRTTPALVQADRFGALRALQRLAPAVWILKGAGTLIGTEGRPMTIVPCAEPNLAVGGSGDVLAGCLGTLMAQFSHCSGVQPENGENGEEPFMTACLGVYWHAQAGHALRERFPHRGNTATEIADALPAVLRKRS